LRFVRQIMGCHEQLASHGCPVGSLCQELSKEVSPLGRKADVVMKAQVDWVTQQFKLLGKRDAGDLGLQLIATLQGVSLLANAMKDPGIVGRQIKRIEALVRDA
jgi:hypothetical protein